MKSSPAKSRQAFALLRKTERMLRSIVEHSRNLFYLHTADHVLIYVSPQSRHFFDCEPEEALVRWTEFVTDHPANRVAMESTQRAIDTGERQPAYQIECVGRSGRKLWVEVNETPVVESGRTVAVVGSLTDITERKRDEEEINRLNVALAARAAELEEANRELEAFSYTVAHDLRKPLTAINGYSQIVQELCGRELSTYCRGYLREISEGVLRMNELIEALLKFSCAAAGPLCRTSVNISDIARDVASDLALAEPQRRVVFRIADEVTVDGDAALLRVVLENLFGNAWKFTAMRDDAVIEFGAAASAGQAACFVRDNGPGFDMTDAARLFSPFQRLPGAEQIDGHGIGLGTVARIVARHGGRIWAEGVPGQGATFWFTL